MQVATFPGLLSYNLFSFVIYIVYWSLKRLPSFKIKRSKHASASEVMLIQVEICILPQTEQSRPQFLILCIENKIIIDFLYFIGICQTRNTYKHEFKGSHLPHSRYSNFCLWIVGQKTSYFICKLVAIKFTLRVVPQIICPELKSIIMTPFIPAHH